MNERRKFLLMAASAFVWAASMLVWAGWMVESGFFRSTGSDNGRSQMLVKMDEPDIGGTLRVPLYEKVPRKIHPLWPLNDAAEQIMHMIYEPLLAVKGEKATEGRLAESWTLSEDEKTVEVILRDNVVWHDGQPLTAKDVAFTYHKLADPDYEGRYRQVARLMDRVDLNEKEPKIVFHLTKSFQEAAELFTVPIIPHHLFHDIPVREWKEWEPKDVLVGTGPYRIHARDTQESITLTRFPDYWQSGQPFIREVTFSVMNRKTAKQQFIQKKIDVLPGLDTHGLPGNLVEGDATIIQQPSDLFHYVAFNPQAEMWQDSSLRAALGNVLDKGDLVREYLQGSGQKIDTPRGSDRHEALSSKQKKAAARLLHRELGQKNIHLHFTSKWIDRDGLARWLQGQWQAVGIDVKTVEHDDVQSLAEAIQSGDAHAFLMTDWVRSDPTDLLDWWTDDALGEWVRWPVAGLTEPLQQAVNTGGVKKKQLLKQWDDQFVKKAPFLPLVKPEVVTLVSADFHEVTKDDFGVSGFDIRQWWVEQSDTTIAKTSP